MKIKKCPDHFSRVKLLASVTAALAAAWVLLCGSVADAQVVNFDVPGGLGGDNFSGQGAYLDPGDNYWNPVVANGTTPAATDADGVTTSTITLTEAEAGNYQGGSPATQGTPAELEYDYSYANNSSTQSCTLSNIPPGTYNLYLYGKNDDQGDANRGTTFTVSVGATSYGTQSTTNSVDSVFTLYNDYVVFTNISVGVAGAITFTYTHNGNVQGNYGNNTEGDFNGLQLINITTVNFDVPGGVGGVNYSGQGAFANPGLNYWNPIVKDGTTPQGTNSDGISVNTITFTEGEAGDYQGGSPATQGTPAELEYHYAYANNSSTQSCALNNIAAGIYSLYLYGKNDDQGDANRGTTFTVSVGATSYGSQSTTNSVDSVFTLDNDYVVFSGLVVSAGETITFTYTHNANGTQTSGNSEGDFNGLQLAPVTLYPPLITEQPTPEVLLAGKTAHFVAAAVAQPIGTVTYQWQTNGVNLSDGATPTGAVLSGSKTGTLTISNVGTADQSTDYQLVATANDNLTASTVPVALAIEVPSGEPYEASVMAQHPLYFYQFNEVTNPASGTAVAFDYEGGDNGIYGVNVANGYSGIAGPTPATGFPGFSSTNLAVQFANGSTAENVTITSPWNLDTNAVTITAWINPNNGAENTSQQIVFSRGGDTVAGLGFGATLDANSLPTLGYTWNNDPETYDWNSGLEVPVNQWSFVALSVTSTNATISIMNTNGLASATHVYSHPLQSFNGSTMIGDDPGDASGANVFPGTIDDVAVFNQALSYSQLTNTFDTASGQVNYAPLIAVQPVPQSVYPTLSVEFTVNAGGSGALTYQWLADTQGNDIFTDLTDGNTGTGSTISGSKTPTLTIANVGAADANNYEVIVSGYGTPATSTPALLTLLSTGGAQNITMSVSEAAGEDWNSGTNWSDDLPAYDSAAAYPGSTFEVLPGAQLRTVDSGQSVSFPGIQLTIDGTNQIGLPAELLLSHSAPDTTFTFQNLIMDGGRLDNGNDGLVTVAGAMNIASNTAIASDPIGTAINFDVPGSYTSVNYSGQGAFSDPGHNYWNAVANNGTTPPGTNADGVTVSPVTFTSFEQFAYNPGGGVQGTPSGLETAYEGITSSGTEANNSLNNVPPGTYNLYIYGVNGAANNHDRGTSFWISSDLTPTTTNSTLNTLAGYDQFIEGNDYVIFSNVVVGSGATIHISYKANPLAGNGNSGGVPNNPPNTEADFNGLQLVKLSPSTDGRPIEINARLAGAGTVGYAASDTNFMSDLNIAGTSNTFSGQWNVAQGTLLGSGSNSLGTNSITVGAAAALETLYNINDPNGILFLNGQIFLHEDDTFKSVALNGAFLAPGTYSAATLAGMNSHAFPASWTEQVGSTYSTSSGNITVLSRPAPVFPQGPAPSSLTLYQGQTAQFTIDAALGTGTISYLWQANSTNLGNGNIAGLGNVSGSTTTNLSIVTTTPGNYDLDVVASSSLSGSSTSLVATLTVLATLPPTTATLTDVQATGNDWNTASDWDIDISAAQLAIQYPGSTNLVPPGTVLNTPDIGGNTPFPGARLIIEGDGNFVNNAGDVQIGSGSTTSELRASEATSALINFPDLRMEGGQLDNTGNNLGNPNAGQSQGLLDLTGEIDIVSNTTFYSDSGVRANSLRTIEIDSWMTGSGTIQYSAFDSSFNSNNLLVTGTSNTFTGQWNVLQGAVLGSGVNSLGTNSITVQTGGALETTYNIDAPKAAFLLNGEMFLHTSDVFGSVTISGAQLAAGTYSFAELADSFPANFPATWPLQIGSMVNTASGSLTVLSGPPGAPAPRPVTITSAAISAGVLTFSGTNGAAAGNYYVFGTTNVALPISRWTVVTNGTFDGSGSFSVSVPVNLGEPAQFYSIESP
jgi:hypothetical protein